MPRRPRTVPGVENRPRTRRDGTAYWTFRVRWTDPAQGRMSREFDDQQDAIDFHATVRLARRRGGLDQLNPTRETLGEYAERWWVTYAANNLEESTLDNYASVWNKHARPRLGHLQLAGITPGVIARFRDDMEAAGHQPPTIVKAMTVVQSVLRRAVEEDRIATNPANAVRKPAVARQRAIQPMAPATVEAIRDTLADRAAAADPENPPTVDMSATLVALLAYSGMRPEEALALEWRHIGRNTILVEQKVVHGQVKVGQKNRRPPRTIDLLAPLRGDLAAYQLALGRPTGRHLVFPRPDGTPMRKDDYDRWRERVWRHAAHQAGLVPTPPTTTVTGQNRRRRHWTREAPYDGPVPYDLRHSYASLRIREGRLSIPELAKQMGHSAAMLLDNYTHIIEELRGQPSIPADQQITQARETRRRRLG